MKKFIFAIICSAFIFILPSSSSPVQAKQFMEQSSLATQNIKKKQKRKIKKHKKKGVSKAKRKHKKAKKKSKDKAKREVRGADDM